MCDSCAHVRVPSADVEPLHQSISDEQKFSRIAAVVGSVSAAVQLSSRRQALDVCGDFLFVLTKTNSRGASAH